MTVSAEARILGKIKDVISAIDFPAPFDDDPVVRHFRYRFSNPEERPSIAIRFVDRQPDTERGGLHSASEECWRMAVDIIIDADLPAEGSGEDPTGLETLVLPAALIFKALRDQDNGLMPFCDDVFDEGVGPEEDSSSDEARLVQSISVLYRTRTGDPTVLLATGEN